MKKSLSFHSTPVAAKLCADPSKYSTTHSSSSTVSSTTERNIVHPLIEFFKTNNTNKEKGWFSDIIKKQYYHNNNNIESKPSSWKDKKNYFLYLYIRPLWCLVEKYFLLQWMDTNFGSRIWSEQKSIREDQL